MKLGEGEFTFNTGEQQVPALVDVVSTDDGVDGIVGSLPKSTQVYIFILTNIRKNMRKIDQKAWPIDATGIFILLSIPRSWPWST